MGRLNAGQIRLDQAQMGADFGFGLVGVTGRDGVHHVAMLGDQGGDGKGLKLQKSHPVHLRFQLLQM